MEYQPATSDGHQCTLDFTFDFIRVQLPKGTTVDHVTGEEMEKASKRETHVLLPTHRGGKVIIPLELWDEVENKFLTEPLSGSRQALNKQIN